MATLTMVFKLGMEAQKHWRRLHGFGLIPKVGSDRCSLRRCLAPTNDRVATGRLVKVINTPKASRDLEDWIGCKEVSKLGTLASTPPAR
jgi:hypothetical protein